MTEIHSKTSRPSVECEPSQTVTWQFAGIYFHRHTPGGASICCLHCITYGEYATKQKSKMSVI